MPASHLPEKKTKIVCTIGPASESPEVLEAMINNGMNIARINFAHGDIDSHRRIIANVRAASATTGRRVAIFGDLPGPKMRIGLLAEEPIELVRGQSFSLLTQEIVGDAEQVSMSFERLPQVVVPGDSIFINDGFIEVRVVSVESEAVHCEVVVGGELRSHKGINFPGIDLGICAFTERDRAFLHFAAEQGLDGVSLSFVEDVTDIEAVRNAANEIGYAPFIIAKIERASACEHLDEILDAADGIMVARGDLGVEIPIEEIASAQKRILRQADLMAVPVITATHMLESMIENNRPTRAEVTDVANAILDGTDCVMLSGESAIGRHPAKTVEVMSDIARVTEADFAGFSLIELMEIYREADKVSAGDRVSLSVYSTCEIVRPTLIFVPSRSGSTARRIARYRLPIWVVAISENRQTCQQLQFSYGIYPDIYTPPVNDWQAFVRERMHALGATGDRVLLTQGTGTLGMPDATRIDIIGLRSGD